MTINFIFITSWYQYCIFLWFYEYSWLTSVCKAAYLRAFLMVFYTEMAVKTGPKETPQ